MTTTIATKTTTTGLVELLFSAAEGWQVRNGGETIVFYANGEWARRVYDGM